MLYSALRAVLIMAIVLVLGACGQSVNVMNRTDRTLTVLAFPVRYGTFGSAGSPGYSYEFSLAPDAEWQSRTDGTSTRKNARLQKWHPNWMLFVYHGDEPVGFASLGATNAVPHRVIMTSGSAGQLIIGRDAAYSEEGYEVFQHDAAQGVADWQPRNLLTTPE